MHANKNITINKTIYSLVYSELNRISALYNKPFFVLLAFANISHNIIYYQLGTPGPRDFYIFILERWQIDTEM